MIKRLKYNEIDWGKYQKCLENSKQYVFFAEKKYLNLLINNHWDVLVYGDYEAVMPVPKVKKLGFYFVLMPLQTQQLGIFSRVDDPQLNDQFYHFLRRNYHIFYYAFNAKNTFSLSLDKRKNFVLEKDNYEDIRKKYSIHRRRNVRILESNRDKIRFEETKNIEKDYVFFKEHLVGFSDARIVENAFSNMKMLFRENLLKVYNLYFEEQLASQAYVLETSDEEVLINFINDKKFLKHNSTSIILDKILQANIENKKFNFHGSNLQEIAEFYRRFGAKEEQYSFISQSKQQLIASFFR